MKSLERKRLKAFCFLFFFVFSVAIVNGHRLAYAGGDMQAMTQFANSHLLEILDNIPKGNEKDYGFENRSVFNQATLGIPYQEYDFEKEKPTGYWRVPVIAGGKNRALLRLKKTSDGWGFFGLGGAELAQELGYHEDDVTLKGNKPQFGRIIRDYPFKCDYVQYGQTPDSLLSGKAYPLKSASKILLKYENRDSTSNGEFELNMIKQMRSTFKEKMPNPESFKINQTGEKE